MSIYNCHKQQPQPWMSYISPNKIVYPGECCPALLTDLAHLLPFQVISNGAYMKMEYSLYGEDSWSEITLPVTTVMTDGFFIHSYNGETLASELPCGVYEFRLTAGELWYFEPIMIEDFTITENALSVRDELMTPFKITEQLADTTPLIAPCDRILPFMFRTDNVTSGSVVVTMVDSDGAETALSITVQTGVIDGKTYYWHRGECLYPFLTCGKYYLKIVDGANTYYSVPFVPECGISDIPDGYQPMRDMNGCVMRDTDGTILYEECSDIPPDEPAIKVRFGYLYNWFAAIDVRIAPVGWHVPDAAELVTLSNFLGGDAVAGGKLKEIGTDNWNTPNTGADNSSGFTLLAGGSRSDTDELNGAFHTGEFYDLLVYGAFWTTSDAGPGAPTYGRAAYYSAELLISVAEHKVGMSIRCLRDTSVGWVAGEQVTDYDGNIYDTVQIGTQVWLVQNLAVTHYNDGTLIPNVTDNAAWLTLSTGARCSYDNDESNAFTI